MSATSDKEVNCMIFSYFKLCLYFVEPSIFMKVTVFWDVRYSLPKDFRFDVTSQRQGSHLLQKIFCDVCL